MFLNTFASDFVIKRNVVCVHSFGPNENFILGIVGMHILLPKKH